LAQKGALGASDRAVPGRWTTKIHALTDVVGRSYALMLTPGNGSDIKAAPALLERAGSMRYLLGDKGYNTDSLRRSLREVGAIPVIPGRCNRKRTIRFDKQRYRRCHLVENAFCRLKDIRRITTRYDKLAANFLLAVALAATVAFWL
jgi:transposase